MAQICIAEIYSGEEYGVMSAAIAGYMTNGRPSEYDERTWADMLLVKHALIAANKMKIEGNTVSGTTENMSSSSYAGGTMTTLEDLYYGNVILREHSFKRGSTYSKALGYIVWHQDDLTPTLTEQQKEVFENLKDCESELRGMNELKTFISGSKLASRIMIKVMHGPSDKED